MLKIQQYPKNGDQPFHWKLFYWSFLFLLCVEFSVLSFHVLSFHVLSFHVLSFPYPGKTMQKSHYYLFYKAFFRFFRYVLIFPCDMVSIPTGIKFIFGIKFIQVQCIDVYYIYEKKSCKHRVLAEKVVYVSCIRKKKRKLETSIIGSSYMNQTQFLQGFQHFQLL